jgi:hypothetical protein
MKKILNALFLASLIATSGSYGCFAGQQADQKINVEKAMADSLAIDKNTNIQERERSKE